MNFRKTTLAIASATLLMSMVGQVSASIYARSYMEVFDLSISLNNTNNTVNNFNFQSDNLASLNGSGNVSYGAACSGIPGIPGAGTNNCNPDHSGGATGLNTPGTVSDAQAVAIGVPYVENSFSLSGPGALEYSKADSVIWDSQLTGDLRTRIEGLAESELQSGTNAAASADIQSATGFTFSFTVGGADPATLTIDFDAIWDTLSAINDPDPTLLATAQGNKKVEFKLRNDTTGAQIIYTPDGNTATGCIFTVGLTCTETTDGGNLQAGTVVSTDPNTDPLSGSGAFLVAFGGLTGDGIVDSRWTFSANMNVSTSLSRQVTSIPEPSVLLLLGASFVGMGVVRRSRKKRA